MESIKVKIVEFGDLKTPTLTVRGERDAFGGKGEAAAYTAPKATTASRRRGRRAGRSD